MNCIDLFAGGGGLSEGFYKQDFNIIAHVEKQTQACYTLKTRHAYRYLKENNKYDIYIKYLKGEINRESLYKEIPNKLLNSVINEEISNDNIQEIFDRIDDLRDDKEIDLIIGGPPCQAYSVIGRARDDKGMLYDKRKYLYRYYIEFLEKYKPKLFVFENVRGILSSNKGRLFKKICREMKNSGYNLEHKVLNASDFGVLQSRKRVIMIGWKNDLDIKYPKFKNYRSKYNIGELFSDLPKLQADTKKSGEPYISKSNKCHDDLNIRDKNINFVTQHNARYNNERDLKIYKIAVEKWNQGERLKYNDLPDDLITHNNTRSFLDRFKVVDSEGLSHTIVAHIAKDGHHYIHPDKEQNRSLTVREAARIQSFPDNYYFETARTPALRQIGNAVPPLMAENIAKKIQNIL